jgi:signal peptidase II
VPAGRGNQPLGTPMRENGLVTNPRPADYGQSAARSGASKVWLFFALALVVLVTDLVTKIVVVATISRTDPGVRLLGGAVYLVQARNSGAAFSVGTGATLVLTAISVLVIVIITRAARRLTSSSWAIALGLVLGGALGNLVDRVFRAPSPGKGHVVDWISLLASDGHVWPIFNIADSSIVVGGALAMLLSLRGVEFDSRDKRGKGELADEPVAGEPGPPEPGAPEPPEVEQLPQGPHQLRKPHEPHD